MSATVYQMRVAKWEEDEVCVECGVEFASPVIAKRLDDGKTFYCPNGHSQSYTETESSKLKRLLESERVKLAQAVRDKEWAQAEARTARTQETKAKNKLKKVVTRVNAGVCPHCNRTFQQLARHMQSKHPEVCGCATEKHE